MEAKKKEAQPKKNELEKQTKMLESDEQKSASDYEKIRLKNIQERLAMFKSLNFGELKHKLAPKKVNNKVDYGSREKSSRIKDKAAQKDYNSVGGGESTLFCMNSSHKRR